MKQTIQQQENLILFKQQNIYKNFKKRSIVYHISINKLLSSIVQR